MGNEMSARQKVILIMRPLVKKSRNVGHTNTEAHSRPRGLLTGCKMSDVPADGPLLIRCNRPPKADIGRRDRHVRLVPKADMSGPATHLTLAMVTYGAGCNRWPGGDHHFATGARG